ncbi:MAG: hypothetical protein R3Y44_07030 [Rikenellaceae bacterium]
MYIELSFGLKIGVYVFSMLFTPQILLYYIEHNYVLPYVSFINNPSNYAYGFTWINAIITMWVAIWLSNKIEDIPLAVAKRLPSKATRFAAGILLSVVVMLGAAAIVAILNMVGVLPILCYALKFGISVVLSIVAFVVMMVVSIFT